VPQVEQTFARKKAFRGSSMVEHPTVNTIKDYAASCSKDRSKNKVNCWKPKRKVAGNQHPSPAKLWRSGKGSETIPKGSTATPSWWEAPCSLTFVWDFIPSVVEGDDIVHPFKKF
jgi:hypothetical protein